MILLGSGSCHATVLDRGRSDAMMEYKGYVGKVEFDDEAGIFHGEVLDTRDVVTFQGQSVDELKAAFQESIDDYLAFCKQRGEEPNKPFSGQFITRVPPELHRQVNLAASISGKSLNAWVVEQLQTAAARVKSIKAARATAKGKGRPKAVAGGVVKRRSKQAEQHA
jgi:predicted HicB family RNase H-like nuclease